MSSQPSLVPRRDLDLRQSERVERLLAAATEELTAVGHEVLTIRMVAARAGISPASAYSYLASKDHLFAELFWRLLATAPRTPLTGRTPAERLRQTIRQLTDLIASSPAVAAAATKSLLGSDPLVARLRLRIGAFFVTRFSEALGADADDRVLDAVALAFFGALLQAGMGLGTFDDVGARLDDVVDVILGGET